MPESAESVVRQFLAAWKEPRVDTLLGFFSQDAVLEDGPRHIACYGISAINDLLEKDLLTMDPAGLTSNVKAAVSDGSTVMAERVDSFEVDGKPFALDVVGVFEVNHEGHITRWREYYDLKSLGDQFKAHGVRPRG